MAPDDYGQTCEDLYRQICQKLEGGPKEHLRFAPRGTSSTVLQDDQLRRFMRSLNLNDPPLTEAQFADRVNERELHDFLATLILGCCSAKAAQAFVTKLAAAPDFDEAIGRLPASEDQLEELFGKTVDVLKFHGNQAYFCTVVLRKGDEVCVEDDGFQRLPYLENHSLRKGSFGEVFKVVIAPGHFHNAHSDDGFYFNTGPLELARKDYILDKEALAKSEFQAMKIMQRGRCDNIVECWGCLRIESTYSLFMPLAICDLSDYIKVTHKAKPQTREAKADIIRCAAGLAAGLHFLHEELMTPELEQLVCYHMDLKPNNVLVYQDKENLQKKVWKLSDFGLSRVKIRPNIDRNFDSLFVQRDQVRDPSASATLNKRGEGTYLAPESKSDGRSMRASSDVWSLGCIMSIIFTYLEEGSEGVDRYSTQRAEYPNADDLDRFFLPRTTWAKSKVHPLVKSWHTELIDKATKRDPKEGQAVAFVLRNLESKVLKLDCKSRWPSSKVNKMLVEAYQKYRGLGGEGSASADHKPPSRASMLRRVESSPGAGVCVRQVAPSDDFKGSVISPDAALVVYWTDTKIVLYMSKSLEQMSGPLMPSDEFILPKLGCLWKSVCLSKKRLIACTTGSNDWYLFDFYGPTAVEGKLKPPEQKVLQVPEVHRLAISPDGSKLVCVAQNEEGGRKLGSLFYAAVSDLFRAGKDREPEANRGWKRMGLEWPAADVVHLSVSDANDVHLVVRPQRTTGKREHKIPMMHVSLRKLTADTLSIKSVGYDGSRTGSFFTTFCPFRHGATCAVVTHDKRLHIQKFDQSDGKGDVEKVIPKYRVRRLLIGDDNRIYALGTTEVSSRMLLLELKVQHLEEELAVLEMGNLPGLTNDEDFSEMLCDEEEYDKYILVAALTRTIYKVAIR
ncbi:hypothetical protein L249_4821 [Ophiocordyceps polyrhachis-furcata BCC 54312]|uniref:Protein kinase domain-containing protein n=1 Tax=Ophiocordyceps polyrhachis-furcata BCC 54312 TaxID=1330021 RepID=A0A367L350_9HYPO|nr:hypothetical protein L249_4821 [Ophiocordyceps polyrhachis-furcata BCC 54312]